MSMSTFEANIARRAMKLIVREIDNPESVPFPSVVRTPDDLGEELASIFVEQDLSDSLDDMEAALQRATDKLVAAHRAAAAVTVDAPTDDEVKAFRAALEALHADIQADQRLRAAINLVVSLQEAIPALAPGSPG
ncbi:hypothetical protein GCM10017083_25580 [Thalassobaculum fulvum]|uniref:Uncharacterized protein n=1 Tax=Thalassobaculum fulvum TaxID=1633335 RepID=A0A918XSV0_9PROT|nr:hypothetical protein [Thalassobaculum fulvum]GHD51306.1 hypothetical protein GCM10017083_25580 [Thalassobaculum fulvum]